MEEALRARVKNRIIVDIRHLNTLKEINNTLEAISNMAGYFCINPSMLISHSLELILMTFRNKNVKAFLDFNLNLPPQQMISCAEKLRTSGVAMVNIQCSAGYNSMKAFMETISKNEKKFSDDHNVTEDSIFSSPRPLVFGVTIPPHMEHSLATSNFGDVDRRMITFNGYVQRANLDGVICKPYLLKSYDSSSFDGILKIATNVVPDEATPSVHQRTITPFNAIKDGADYLLIDKPIVNQNGLYATEKDVFRIMVEIAHALQVKDRLKRVDAESNQISPASKNTKHAPVH